MPAGGAGILPARPVVWASRPHPAGILQEPHITSAICSTMNPAEPHDVMACRLEHDLDARPGWAHPSCMAILDGLTLEQATWRPGPGRRCIWEYVRHMLRWRQFVAHRMEGGRDPEPEDQWPAIPLPDDPDAPTQWAADLAGLRSTTDRIAAALRTTPVEARHPSPAHAHLPAWISPLGVLQHDSYHLGQIALLRGLQGMPPIE